MSTDAAWEEWGKADPYFGVLTNPKFRLSEITEKGKQLFFESGRGSAAEVLNEIRRHIVPEFMPKTVLDFGCGVGRVLIPFAKIAQTVVGVDVSASMLVQAKKHCLEHGLTNVRLASSDDALSQISETFDLVHSAIVFQHIPAERGKLIFRELLRRVAPGGVGAIQVLYSKAIFAANFGVTPPPPKKKWYQRRRVIHEPGYIPMQMNPYNLNELLFLIQDAGASQFHAKFTDHGGELGVFLYFRLPEKS